MADSIILHSYLHPFTDHCSPITSPVVDNLFLNS